MYLGWPDATWYTLSSDPLDQAVVAAVRDDLQRHPVRYQSRLSVGDTVLHTLVDRRTGTSSGGQAVVLAVGVHSALVQESETVALLRPGYVTLQPLSGGPPFDMLHRTNPGVHQRHLRKLTVAEAVSVPKGTIDRDALEGDEDADGSVEGSSLDSSQAAESPGEPPLLAPPP